MNIIYIDHYAGSPDMGMEFRPYYLAREWVKMGHDVKIIAGDYSHLRKKNPQVDRDFQSEMIDGIEYVWFKTGRYEGNGVKRALTMWNFVRKLYVHAGTIARKWKPDVVIASSTYPLDSFPARRIAKKAAIPYIHEVHDLWPATLYEVGGMSRRHPFVVVMQIGEDYAYKHCDRCVSLPPYTKDYMVRHGLDPSKWTNIQNGVVLDEWLTPADLPEEHRKFFDEHKDKFIVGYFGGHGLSNALDNCLDLAKYMNKKAGCENIIFTLVGEGTEKKRLMDRASDEHIGNVAFLPGVDKREIPSVVRYFDCCFMTAIPSELYKYGLCFNKIYDSMMAGKPIVCAITAPDTLIKQYDCGFQCDPDDLEEVSSAIMKLYDMSPDMRDEIGKKGREAIERSYTYEKLAESFINCIHEARKSCTGADDLVKSQG